MERREALMTMNHGAVKTTSDAAPSEQAWLEAKGVWKTFQPLASTQPFVALRNIDLRIPRGRFTVIIGPSGCGKSTLLRIMAGLAKASQGGVYHAGDTVHGASRARGFVFQADAVFPWLSVRKNVEFGPKSSGMARRRRADIATHWCQMVHLDEYMDAYPKELSGGMRKRVDLARVYANDPDVLFMDEPFGALDAQTKEVMQDDLIQLWEKQRKTVVFVTHDVDEATYLADDVIVMSSKPGEIAHAVQIDLPRPRSEDTRISDDFAIKRRELRELLRSVTAKNRDPNDEETS